MEQKTKILVIDNDADTFQSVETMMVSLGYEAIQADSRQARVKVEETLPDLLLLGSLSDGLNIIRDIRQGESIKTVPILMLIEIADMDKRASMLDAGADDFIIKPIDKIELVTRVRSLLKVKAYNDHIINYQHELEAEVTKRTQDLTKAIERVKVTSLDTVYRLSRAAEYKDEATGAHVQRMSHYSSAIARAMGLDNKFIENILWAAPMHDIGKIGIPDNILLKPGKLDDNEWVIMKTHTTIGAEILKDADAEFIKLAADIAITHHEKWTGGGYPKGIKGTDIPLAGRIVALADVFDALTSERPYKRPMPLEQALTIIKEGKGSHFDPQVADAFFSIEEEIKSELNWWKFMSAGNPSEDADMSNLFK